MVSKAIRFRFNYKVTFLLLMIFFNIPAALAVSTYYSVDYISNNIPASQYKVGTVLGTVYMRAGDIYYHASQFSKGSFTATLALVTPFPSALNDTGCLIPGALDNSLGLLPYNNSVPDPKCARTRYVLGDFYAVNADQQIRPPFALSYIITLKRTKLFDIVINKLQDLRSHAGQDIQIPQRAMPSTIPVSQGDNFGWFTTEALTGFSVHIDGSPPQAFFPSTMSSLGHVNLNVQPVNTMATAKAGIEMCLYDGKNLTSSRYTLTFTDANTSNTSSDFTLGQLGGSGQLNYRVSITDPANAEQPVMNRTPINWSNMKDGGDAKSRVRYITMPTGMAPCVPTTVTLKLKPVKYNSLQSGDYSGTININFSVST